MAFIRGGIQNQCKKPEASLQAMGSQQVCYRPGQSPDTVLFFINNADDDEILQDLANEGWHIGKWTLVRPRYDLGWRGGIRSVEVQPEADRLVQMAISEELLTDGYGKEMLYAHFKSTYYAVKRDILFRNYCMLNPEAEDFLPNQSFELEALR